MTPGNPHLLIFARYPALGKAKTRLIPALGPEGAARLHRRMTEYAVGVTRDLKKSSALKARLEITVYCTGASLKNFQNGWGETSITCRREPVIWALEWSGHLTRPFEKAPGLRF